MKEMLIAFIIALVIGSIWNQMNGADPQWAPNKGTGGGGIAAPNAPNVGTSNTGAPNMLGYDSVESQQASAGQELVVDIDEGSFQGYVLDAREPVLVEFYNDHCQYCTKMEPVMGQLAYNGQGVVRVCKINSDKAPSLVERYEIEGVPAFVLFSEGHKLDQRAGATDFQSLRSWLSQNNVTVPPSVSQSIDGARL